MRRTVSAEFIKLSKNKIYLISAIIVLVSAIIIVVKDLLNVSVPLDFRDWLKSCYMVTGLILPIMSGFVISFSIQQEYEERTIINVLTAPTSRIIFLFSKVIVWFIWYIIVLFGTEIIYSIGGFLIYPSTFGTRGVSILIYELTKFRLLGYLAAMPLLWIAILQKKMFYPTVMATLFITGIELAAINMPMNIATCIPWSAVTIVAISSTSFSNIVIGVASIFIAGIIGIVLSCITFIKQDL